VATAFNLACLLGVFTIAAGTGLAQLPARSPGGPAAQRPGQPAATPPPLPSASGGKVMYFQKPADALVPISGSGGGEPAAQATIPVPTGNPAPPAESAPDWSAPPVLPVFPAPAAPKTVPTIPERSVTEMRPPVPAPAAPTSVMPPAPAPAPAATLQPGIPLPPLVKPDQPKGSSAEDIAKWTKLPPRDEVFLLMNDADLERSSIERLRQEVREQVKDPFNKYPKGLIFPDVEPVGRGVTYTPKTSSYQAMQAYYDSLYVVHRRLHFEERNAERAGWDLGIIQPFVSAMFFYRDVFLWPNSFASGCVYGFWDSSAGKCLPGSPTPYLLYPPGLTITGSALEGAIITGAAFAFP